MHVNVAIVGLDRLGASFGLALKRYQSQPRAEHTFNIIGSDSKAHPMKEAHKMGAIDNFNRALLKATENADLIILNATYGATEETYARLGPALKPGAVVLDTSQLKRAAIEWASRHFTTNEGGKPLAYLVGIMPVINASALYEANQDVEAARADLFDNGEVLIAPDIKCPSEAIALAEDVVRLIGSKPRFIDPIEHDGLIAATEGLPTLLGAALFHTLHQSEGWPELRRMVNPTLALAVQALRYQTQQDLLALFTQNRDNLARHLEGLIGMLDQVRDALLDTAEPEKLEAFLAMAQSEWEKWDVKRHSGKWEDVKEPEMLPGPFGSVGGFLSMTRRKPKDEDED